MPLLWKRGETERERERVSIITFEWNEMWKERYSVIKKNRIKAPFQLMRVNKIDMILSMTM